MSALYDLAEAILGKPRTLADYTGTPQDQADATEMYKHGLYGLPIGAASNIIPPVVGGAPPSDWKSYVPGGVPLAGNFFRQVGEWGLNAFNKAGEAEVNAALPPGTEPVQSPYVTIPGGPTMEKMNADAVTAVKTLLPKYEATTDAAKVGENIGVNMGQGAAFVAPEAITTRLPSVVSSVIKAAVPPVHAAPLGAILGGVGGAFTPTDQAQAEPAPQPQAGPLPMPPPPTLTEPLPMPPLPSLDDKLHPGDRTTDQSSLSYLDYAAATAVGAGLLWGAAKYGPRTLNTVSDVIRGNLRDVPEANALLHSRVPAGLEPNPIEMPLPNNAGGMTRQWAAGAYNPNAVLNEYAKGTYGAGSPAADAMIATNEAINNPANSNRRMESLFRTGVEEGTGHQFPKIVDYKEAVDAMTPGQQESANWGAWLKNELNIRSQKIKAAASEGKLWTPQNDPQFRVSFTDMDTDQMRQAVQTIERDPQIKAFLDQNKAIQSSIVDSAEKRGLITSAQADYARKNYADFMPTIDAEGNYLHSWDGKIRDANTGYSTPPQPAWDAMIQHFDRSIRGAQKNDWQRGIILNQDNIQKTRPGSAEIVTERRMPTDNGDANVGKSLGRSITVQTSEGPRTFDINNSAFYRGLTGGPQQMTTGQGIVNGARRLYQNLTTGPLAMAFGHPFAFKNFLRDSMLIPGQGQGWRGSLDRAFNTRLPYDPTFPIGAGQTAIKDSASVITKNFSDILGSSSNPASASLRSMFGDSQVDSWVNWMRAQFEHSSLAQREAMGVGSGGNRSTVEVNNLVMDKGGTYRDPTSRTVAPLMNKLDFNVIPSRVPLPNFLRNTVNGVARGAVQSYLNLSTMARDLYGVISDAPHSFYHDINIDNPKFTPRTLANEVQTVTGNPGTQGQATATRAASRTIPYYNPSMQGIARSLAAFRDHPIQVASTIMTVLLGAAAAEHLSALVSGKEHVDHFENQITNSSAARNFFIYHGPGTDPTDHTEIPVPIEWQVLKPFISALVGHALGTWNAYGDADTLSRVTHTLAGLHDDHVSSDIPKQQVIGAINALPPAALSVPADLAFGAAGYQVKDVPQQLAANAMTGRPLASGMVSGDQPAHKVPGQEGTDGLLVRSDAGVLKAVMSALGAAGASSYTLYHDYMQRSKISPEWAKQGLWEDYKQEWKDNTQFLNSVWRNNLPLSSYGALEERTNQMWRPVAAASGVRSDIRGEGFTGVTHPTPLPMTGDTPLPADPQMRNLYITMMEQGKVITKEIMPKENLIRSQLTSLKDAPYMPDERRRIQNKLSDELYDVTAQKHQMLLDLNARLSKLADGRHVDVGMGIDWQGTLDQFHH